MKKRVSWLMMPALIAAVCLMAGFGAAPLAAEEGWCCKEGAVFAATPEMCKEKGGAWFASKEEAEKFCRQEPTGWCCVNGVVWVATPEQCKEKGGKFFWNRDEADKACLGYCCHDGLVDAMTVAECREKGGAWFATQAEAERYCKQTPPAGWCCKDGVVFAATPAQCKEKGGAWFATQAEAERYCKQTPPAGWCCRDGVVFAATPAQCKEKGGAWFATQAEAERYCKQTPPTGWCCREGVVFAATPAECKEKGGVWFATQAEAERYCRPGQKLPDLVIKDITLSRNCQVVVTVANPGPGTVPDSVWTVHSPTSCSVYIFINGRKWGGKTVWGFDPGRLLQPAGGVARYASDLIVSAEAEITAVIDLTAEVAETQEDNNKMIKKVRCAPANEGKPLR